MAEILKTENQISIPSSLDYLKDVDYFVEAKLKKCGLTESDLADVAISVTEAVTNAVIHGNKNDLQKRVTITLEIREPDITVWVKDQGNGFDPNSVPSPVENDNVLKKVGRGIFILKSLMDEVDFTIEPGEGTVVKFTKHCETPKNVEKKDS
jgi:serine/threonine-protein kinase RsbW